MYEGLNDLFSQETSPTCLLPSYALLSHYTGQESPRIGSSSVHRDHEEAYRAVPEVENMSNDVFERNVACNSIYKVNVFKIEDYLVDFLHT